MKYMRHFLLAVLLLSALGINPTVARASSTITVTNLFDDVINGNGCSLREAITNANNDALTYPDCVAGSGSDTITFNSALNGSILLTSALPILSDTDGLSITGGSARVTVNGGDTFRVFEIPIGVSVTVQNLTIIQGFGDGGNINNAGTLILLSSTLTDATGTLGGAIYNSGTANITNSTFTLNTADFGAAVYNNLGTVTIVNSTINDNTSSGGGDGVLYNNGTMTVKNTIVTDGNGSLLCAGNILNFASANNLAEVDLSCGASFSSVGAGTLALGALADNGGSTRTFALGPASLAIGAGDNASCPATDQRNVSRPQGTTCDAGSFESKVSFSVSPSSLSFGSVPVGFTSAAKTVTITNTGEANLSIGVITTTGEFAITDDLCSGMIIAPGNSCTFGVTFTPATPVAKTGTASIPSNTLVSPTIISLSGAGITPTNYLLSPTFDAVTRPIPWRNPLPPYTLHSVLDCSVSLSVPCSVRFSGDSNNRLRQIFQSMFKRGSAGSHFVIRLSSKADSVPAGGTYRGALEFYNVYNKLIAVYALDFSHGTHDWEHLESYVTVPAGYTRMIFRIAYRNTSGTVWFDDAAVIPVP